MPEYSGFHRITDITGKVIAEKYEWRHVLQVLSIVWPTYGLIDHDDDSPIEVVVLGVKIATITFVEDW